MDPLLNRYPTPLIQVLPSARNLNILLTRGLRKRGNHAVTEWLIKWKRQAPKDATWELAELIEIQFPQFDPWGQGSSQGGGDVTSMNQAQTQVEYNLAEDSIESGPQVREL